MRHNVSYRTFIFMKLKSTAKIDWSKFYLYCFCTAVWQCMRKAAVLCGIH